MTNSSQHVVVAYDFTATSAHAMRRAINLAASQPSSVLHFVCVVEPHGSIPLVPRTSPTEYEYAEQVQALLSEHVANELRATETSASVHFFVHVRIGKPAVEILGLAREIGADLIVLGTKGLTGVEHFVLGSVAERVAREAGCSIEIVKPKTYEHVDLLQMVKVEPQRHYVPPHRYSYEDRRVQVRPKDWPMY